MGTFILSQLNTISDKKNKKKRIKEEKEKIN